MKTSVIDVRDMLSVLSVQGVEERIGEVPGVESVTVNHAAATATVRYDETRLHVSDIKSNVRQRSYEAANKPTPGQSVESEPAGQVPPQQSPVPSPPGGCGQSNSDHGGQGRCAVNAGCHRSKRRRVCSAA